ncbi:hypothetical protein [Streptomyces achromogenes]|uniref:hypothetical protein n=1 Tax=Streptomyces achromogenes TaxID=67255 RepID=UPI0027D805C4|nr:hypothetical protein [Streptomyces achromogenes]
MLSLALLADQVSARQQASLPQLAVGIAPDLALRWHATGGLPRVLVEATFFECCEGIVAVFLR